MTRRSYLGIASCVIFCIATGAIGTVLVSAQFASHLMAGLEIVVIGPFALLLYFGGIIFGVLGLMAPLHNPFSRTGVVLNILPFGYLFVVALIYFIL